MIKQDVEQKCPLSPRETEILALIAAGMENKAIAKMLNLSAQTIRTYVSHAMTSLDVQNRTRAVVLALQYGWIAFPGEEK